MSFIITSKSAIYIVFSSASIHTMYTEDEGGREGGRKEGREGREGYWGAREGGWGREGGMEGREGGRDDCYTYSNRYVQFFFYRNVLFVNSNMMHVCCQQYT